MFFSIKLDPHFVCKHKGHDIRYKVDKKASGLITFKCQRCKKDLDENKIGYDYTVAPWRKYRAYREGND